MWIPGQRRGFRVIIFWDLKLNPSSVTGIFSRTFAHSSRKWGGGLCHGCPAPRPVVKVEGPAVCCSHPCPASCRYVGELISDSEADVREEDSYLFDLDNKVTRLEGLGVESWLRPCGVGAVRRLAHTGPVSPPATLAHLCAQGSQGTWQSGL